MSVVSMQPYPIPYLGYFSLVHGTNAFVFADAMSFIKRSIDQNIMLLRTGNYMGTVPYTDNKNTMIG